ncbi:MAG: nucleotidyltransferase domain-containing protein [Candidatus Brocadia sp.]|nr:nucleotidyltransferase domain-containing protein [Candidatus Brocadia sp.]
MDAKDIVEKLKCYFEKRKDISMAFLFGSWAKCQGGIDSDVDIAIYFEPNRNILEWEKTDFWSDDEKAIWLDIEKIIEKEVDLLVLNRAAPTIADSALKGIPIIIKNRNLYMEFLLRITSEAIDFRQWVESYWNFKEKMKHGVTARR